MLQCCYNVAMFQQCYNVVMLQCFNNVPSNVVMSLECYNSFVSLFSQFVFRENNFYASYLR